MTQKQPPNSKGRKSKADRPEFASERIRFYILDRVLRDGYFPRSEATSAMEEDTNNIDSAIAELQKAPYIVLPFEGETKASHPLILATQALIRRGEGLSRRLGSNTQGKLKVAKYAASKISPSDRHKPIFIGPGATTFLLGFTQE